MIPIDATALLVFNALLYFLTDQHVYKVRLGHLLRS